MLDATFVPVRSSTASIMHISLHSPIFPSARSRNPVADRPAAGATRASVRLREADTIAENDKRGARGCAQGGYSTDRCGRDARFTVVEPPREGGPASQQPAASIQESEE
jgi:hypothetical protein